MGDVIPPLPDGYGGRVGDRYPMPLKPGTHEVYARGPELVVEWYDFGPHAPYESANLVIFDRPAQEALVQACRLAAHLRGLEAAVALRDVA